MSRVLRLTRLDLALMRRNRTSLLSVFGIPAFFGAMLVVAADNGHTTAGLPAAVYTGTGDLAFFLLFSVFINLTGVFTARREDGRLKRLRGGPVSELEILGGSALAACAVYLAMSALIMLLIGTVLGAGPPADPVLVLAGMLLGAAVFTVLALALSGVTPTAELAQWTVTPVMILCMAGSGFMFPLDGAPDPVRWAAELLPLTPVVEIVRTGCLGLDFGYGGDRAGLGLLDGWAACGPAFAVLLCWLLAGAALARRWFRWEPRHA